MSGLFSDFTCKHKAHGSVHRRLFKKYASDAKGAALVRDAKDAAHVKDAKGAALVRDAKDAAHVTDTKGAVPHTCGEASWNRHYPNQRFQTVEKIVAYCVECINLLLF